MLELTIKITGKTTGDLELALEQVNNQLSEGYIEGFDRNENGRYSFKIQGEEENDDDA